MLSKTILIIDDEKAIQNVMKAFLEDAGYITVLADDGLDGIEKFHRYNPDLVLLDLMLPGLNGEEVLPRIKGIPVIVVSAKADMDNKVDMLLGGAVDYVTKPFNPLELIARVKSNLRRYTKLGSLNVEDNAVYRIGGLCMNDNTKEVTVDGEPVKLTPIEYNILFLLVKNQGKVFSIDQIYENIWNEEAIGADNTVAVHIRHIREKIEINPKEPRYLKVVWGVGYKVEKQ